MSLLRIEFKGGNLHLPELGLWLDPHEPILGPEKVFVSHAHSDHVAAHREVVLSEPTSRLMQARVPGERLEHTLEFGEKRRFTGREAGFEITLVPAGHIFGSAMALIETEGESLLYTGDFKLRRGLSAEPCEPRLADILIMETTYGRPQYFFPPTDGVIQGVIRFCREALDNDETPVLLGYSLGKSQEILCGLGEAGLPLMLHGTIYRLTQIYEQFGQCFPKYEHYEAGSARGKVLLCPPNVTNSAMLRNLGKTRSAILTGWAVDPNCRFRYQCDAGFPLSDHADFPDLIELVKRVQPKKVFTFHGFAAEFAHTLRDMGYDASALSEDEQLVLGIGGAGRRQIVLKRKPHEAAPISSQTITPHPSPLPVRGEGSRKNSPAEPPNPSHPESIVEPKRSPLPSRGEGRVRGEIPPEGRASLVRSNTATTGSFSGVRPSTGAATVNTQQGLAKFIDPAPFEAAAPAEGGTPLNTLTEGKANSPAELAKTAQHSSVNHHPFLAFAEACSRIAGDRSKLEKIRHVAEYLRTLDGDAVAMAATWFSGRPFPASQNKVLQLGWAVMRDAFCAVGHTDEAALHQIYLKHSDVGETAAEVLYGRQVAATLSVEEVNDLFHRLHVARGPLGKTPLFIRALERSTPIEAKYLVKIITGDLRIGLKEGLVEDAVASAFQKPAGEIRQANLLLGDIGETAKLAAANRLAEASLVPFRPIKFMLASPEATAADILERVADWGGHEVTVWLEDKYDGIRCQLHKVANRVALYSRDLKDITKTFLELADSLRKVEGDFILDGEIVAMRGEQVLPFAELQKRLGRREGDLFMREEVPIQYIAFDLLWFNGETWLNRPLRERRQKLETIRNDCLRYAHTTEAKSIAEIDEAFTGARTRGNEGLMIKDPTSIYTPGRRGLAWLKLKKALATLDCVVVGAEYGHGKRNKVLSDYTFAVRDEVTGELKTIGKAYSGLTDAEIEFLTGHFLKHAKRQRGRYFEVEPNIVLEIAFDKIQESDRHNSGLAMRFPRIARIRTDKPVSEIDTVETARKLVERTPSERRTSKS